MLIFISSIFDKLIYETYDLFGKDADVFKESNGEENTVRSSGNNSILKMLEGVNLDKISETIAEILERI